MRRQISALLGFLLALCLLSGCGSARSEGQTGEQIPTETIEALIPQILLDRSAGGYQSGECPAEGHVLLDIRQDGEDQWQVYLLASVGQYGFCSGHFECVSGSGAIPTRITLRREDNGTFTCGQVWEPMDGNLYTESIKETFPRALWNKALNADKAYDTLKEQKEAYARAYLESIGREAPIGNYGDFDHPLFTENGMSTEVSNALLAMEKLRPFPLYIGNTEYLEDGVRYVCETAWDHRGDGTGTAVYTRYEYDTHRVLQRYVFQVEGDSFTETTPQAPGEAAS